VTGGLHTQARAVYYERHKGRYMKTAFAISSAICLVAGFVFPALWAAALLLAVLAVGAAPSGRRQDGKRRTGGLLGGLWDDLFDKGPQQ